ncbi:hypothetical protein QJS66_10475 [Kocuria rhizophila]|nr:hypothetical protein QJS66_10475 [Kocuria rhizophila]
MPAPASATQNPHRRTAGPTGRNISQRITAVGAREKQRVDACSCRPPAGMVRLPWAPACHRPLPRGQLATFPVPALAWCCW